MRRVILVLMALALFWVSGCAEGGTKFYKAGVTPNEMEMAKLECQRMAMQIGPHDGEYVRYANYLRCMRASGYSW